MPYLGNEPATQFTDLKYQDLTGGSGTSFTLDHSVGNAQAIEVFVNNVRQEPGVAYTVSGTALTMTGSIASTDDFYVIFQGVVTSTATHPATSNLEAADAEFTGDLTVDTDTLHVDSANNRVGVGTTSGDGKFHVHTSTAGTVTAATDANDLVLERTTNVGMSMLTGNASVARIKFADPDATNAGVIAYNHSNNTLSFNVNATEELRIDSDGIKFNGDTASANGLYDYEFGTWTPAVSAGSITNANGHYIKVGGKVWIGFSLSGVSDTTSTTQLQINNLPFTPSANANNSAAGAVFSRYLSPSPNATYVATNLYFYVNGGTGQYAASKHQNFNSSSAAVFGEATYYTTS